MIHVLRLLHIFSGVFWYGALLFVARFLMPSLRAVGPAAGPIMGQLNQRRMPLAMLGAGTINVASGIWLMWFSSGGAFGDWSRTGMGRTLSAGGALAIVAFLIGATVNSSAAKRLGEIATAAAKRGGPPPPEETAEVARLQGRLGTATTVVLVLLSLTTATMAVARYLP